MFESIADVATLLFAIYLAVLLAVLGVLHHFMTSCRDMKQDCLSHAREASLAKDKALACLNKVEENHKKRVDFDGSTINTLESLIIQIEDCVSVMNQNHGQEDIGAGHLDDSVARLRSLRASLTLESRLNKIEYASRDDIAWGDISFIEDHAEPRHVHILRSRIENKDLNEMQTSRLLDVCNRLDTRLPPTGY